MTVQQGTSEVTVVSASELMGGSSSVEGIDERDDLRATLAVFVEGVFARRLDRTLVCLRARVAEEDAAHARPLAKKLGEFRAGRGVVEV